jgi:hypothetical protein
MVRSRGGWCHLTWLGVRKGYNQASGIGNNVLKSSPAAARPQVLFYEPGHHQEQLRRARRGPKMVTI